MNDAALRVKAPDSLRADRPSFESLLPSIQRCASYAYRHLPWARRQEAMADVVANAYLGFVRLKERQLDAIIFATPLAKYAIKRVNAGRHVGCRQNRRDLLSSELPAKSGVTVQRLDRQDDQGDWQERLITDRRATPAELASYKLDFGAWLSQLKPQKRAVALRLAAGDTTYEAASHFRVSAARVSQLRRELQFDWHAFQGASALL